ncbi:hypothetical protein QYE76_019430 [Lolium multiflorum]|uniref:Integrase zinc-binding domain-containing protein n=1 Tax=Lolium multiflorum TaxID=4521 RepID=A0AAD8R326_LOLMU|nr:hypothetical protein QYE76_019430 [Lolium multiflorum]
MSSSDAKIVNQKNKDAADVMTQREYEALRNEMRREFHTQDEELKRTVQEVAQKLDITNETVNKMQDQMTDIQRSIQALTLAVDNLTQQQQQEDEDAELQDEALGVGHGAGRGNRGHGFVEVLAVSLHNSKTMVWESHVGGLMGHFGREKTLLMLADHFYWPNEAGCGQSQYGGIKRADFVRKIHVKTKELIEKKGKKQCCKYEEGASIARGGEEQLGKKLDVKLDMELAMKLDMKTSHGRAREGGMREGKKTKSSRRRARSAGPGATGRPGPAAPRRVSPARPDPRPCTLSHIRGPGP